MDRRIGGDMDHPGGFAGRPAKVRQVPGFRYLGIVASAAWRCRERYHRRL